MKQYISVQSHPFSADSFLHDAFLMCWTWSRFLLRFSTNWLKIRCQLKLQKSIPFILICDLPTFQHIPCGMLSERLEIRKRKLVKPSNMPERESLNENPAKEGKTHTQKKHRVVKSSDETAQCNQFIMIHMSSAFKVVSYFTILLEWKCKCQKRLCHCISSPYMPCHGSFHVYPFRSMCVWACVLGDKTYAKCASVIYARCVHPFLRSRALCAYHSQL